VTAPSPARAAPVVNGLIAFTADLRAMGVIKDND
jgi:hypothetical protein